MVGYSHLAAKSYGRSWRSRVGRTMGPLKASSSQRFARCQLRFELGRVGHLPTGVFRIPRHTASLDPAIVIPLVSTRFNCWWTVAPSRQLQRTHDYVTWPDVFLRRDRGRGLGAFVGRDGGNRTCGLAGRNRLDPAFGVTCAGRAGLPFTSDEDFVCEC